MKRALSAGLILASLAMSGCGPAEPIRIGFVGGLTGSSSDVGTAGRDAVLLAIEQANAAGGVGGRKLEMVERDDAQDKAVAARSAQDLASAGVVAVIGPFTSAMADATVPVLGKAGIVSISPTLTAMAYFGKDDDLIRINRTTRDNANDYAAVLLSRRQKRVAVAFDTRNRAFTESWLDEFRKAMVSSGGELVAEVAYESRPDTPFDGVVAQMLKHRPDGLFFISPTPDVVRLSEQAKRVAPQLPIGATEWAASEGLLTGGKAVEGLVIVQNYNRDDDSARYTDFRTAFERRFGRNPGYSAVSAYDAATVLLAGLAKQAKGETPKQAILKYGPYQGLQQQIAFDANGDTLRKVFFTEIRDGRFVLMK
ncbi:MAG: ABC transporter substrate-binding protein [Rhodocyclaceae bacterium]|nr:ABC transporter substrate-binding protein [Rhodocyclaceae bacterium]